MSGSSQTDAPPSVRSPSMDERRRLIAQSLHAGNPGNNARSLPEQADPRVECQIELDVDLIEPYEANPRRTVNPRFDEIRESIREVGIRNPLTVTRRPGERHFIVEAGGNTRLIALRELWQETRDPRFQRLVVLFRPWRSEQHVLSAHLIENELRGELSFWDKAVGIQTLKRSIEADEGVEISLREFALELQRLGLAVGKGTLSHWLFAAERLPILGNAIPVLSGLDVRNLQPRLNALKRYARGRAAMPEDVLYERVLPPVFEATARQYTQTSVFSVDALGAACEIALAAETGDSVGVLREIVEDIAELPQLTTASSCPIEIGHELTVDTEALTDPAGDGSVQQHAASTKVSGRCDDSSSGVVERRMGELARAFASASGIEHCLAPDENVPTGFRLISLSNDEATETVRGRAWCLLAWLFGQSSSSVPALPLDAAFVHWLTDSRDAAANVCWELLTAARASGGSRITQESTWVYP